MKTVHKYNSIACFSATALVFCSSCLAGEIAVKSPVVPEVTTPAANPLSFGGGRFTFDIQERMRMESRENTFDFNDAADSATDDTWLLQRVRVGMKVKPSSGLSFYFQGQDAREFGSDRANVPGVQGAEGDDPFDLRQAWVQVGGESGLSLRLGRQVLQYGDERLIGPLDWSNLSRTFDAARLRYAAESWSLDLFTSSVVTIDGDGFNRSDWIDSDSNRDQFFSGLYFSTTAVPAHTIDGYALELHETAEVGDTDFVTLGLRIKADASKRNGWEYESEVATQFGELQGLDLWTAAVHVGGGYAWLHSPWKPRLALEYNYGSGDGDPRDGEDGTFQNLFPTNHKFYGAMDLFSWQNMHQPGVAMQATPISGLTVKVEYCVFWLADTEDAWYRANGKTPVRPITPDADAFAGSELDVTINWKAASWIGLSAGYSHFFAGKYLAASGPNDDADFAFVMATLDF